MYISLFFSNACKKDIFLMQSFNSYFFLAKYGFQNIFLSILKILQISSSEQTSKIRFLLFQKYFFTHFRNLCIRFVTAIQYEQSFYIPIVLYFFSLDFFPIFSIYEYQVFLAGNTISVTFSYWWKSTNVSMESPKPFCFISSFPSNIYTMNWMISSKFLFMYSYYHFAFILSIHFCYFLSFFNFHLFVSFLFCFIFVFLYIFR